nr:hypothetical protein [Streptomyces lydicus]
MLERREAGDVLVRDLVALRLELGHGGVDVAQVGPGSHAGTDNDA